MLPTGQMVPPSSSTTTLLPTAPPSTAVSPPLTLPYQDILVSASSTSTKHTSFHTNKNLPTPIPNFSKKNPATFYLVT